MTKYTKTEETVEILTNEVESVEVKTESEPTRSPLQVKANEVLNETMDKFEVVIVVGLTANGQIDINSNLPQYPTMQWLLDRAKFELLIHERNTLQPVK